MESTELRKLIKYVLTPFNLYSEDVEELLIFTAAVETDGCKTRIQNGYKLSDLCKGMNFGLGFFQTEPYTYKDLRRRYHKRYSFDWGDEFDLVLDEHLMILVARIKYLDCPDPIPDKNDINAIWHYYKDNYNSAKGASEKEKSLRKYVEYIK